MIELVEANWPLFLIALVIGIIAAWWIFVALRKTSVATDKTDVLDEGKGPANRNQALIDAPPAAGAPPAVAPVSAAPEPVKVAVAEPVATAPSPVVAAEQAPAAAPTENTGAADDLSRIKGVGPKLKAMLIAMEITSFEQIANWTEQDIDRIDAELGRFQGRIRRDSWTEQARMLAADDMAAYEAKFGKL
ncbi:hypothetical protein GRI43_01430 [Altererythrobacter luteolus]|uniref:Uncharacterized protein n=1 Tax=Pontixanthobacter luteolus TaxID=295089 RepID=A0A6I4V278_9SPHN|nr:hypothetical protein [Pontixanthobacter luteolus]MXP46052.1 hypothetical protein [Pontixanthobacter luteolus]